MNKSKLPLCGVIMGYYGQIWSTSDLRGYAQFCAQYNLQTFFYGPKNDDYLRANWYTAWPQSNFEALQAIRGAFKEATVNFGVVFSPLNISDLGDNTRNQLRERVTGQLNQLELDVLCVGFDDISGDVVSDLGENLAGLQVDVAEYIRELSNARQFYVVPSYYSLSPILVAALGPMPSNYFLDFGQIAQEFGIFWTGSNIVSNGFSLDGIKEMNELFGRKVTLWDNYPANDALWMTMSAANIYPFTGRPYQLADYIDGHFANPMIQPELSKIPLSTLPQIYHKKENYAAQDEFIRATKTFCQDEQLANYLVGQLMSFREISYRPTYGGAITRLRQSLSPLNGASKIKSELMTWLNYVEEQGQSNQT